MEYRVEDAPTYAKTLESMLNMLSEDEGWELAGIIPAANATRYAQVILQRPKRGVVRD